MEIEKSILLNIKDILDTSKALDEKDISKIFDLLNSQEDIVKKATIYFDKKVSCQTDMFEGDININLDELKSDSKRVDVLTIDDVVCLNYYILATVLHEYMHYYQFLFANYNINEYSDINRLYKTFINDVANLRFNLCEFILKETMMNERNANLFSFYNVAEIASNETKTMYQEMFKYCLVSNYFVTKKRIKNPIEETLKWAHLKNDYDFSNMSLLDKYFYGTPITLDDAKKVICEFDGKLVSDVKYDMIIKKLKG